MRGWDFGRTHGGEVESWAASERDVALGECEDGGNRNPESRAFVAVGWGWGWWRGMEGKGGREMEDIQGRSRTSDARLSMAACKHWITRRRSAAELIGRPSNRLM